MHPQLQILQQSILAGNIPQLLMSLIAYSVVSRASDIHIEPQRNYVRIRVRIDGVLREIVEYPGNLHPAVVSRVKITANLKIDEQRIPQDGRSHVTSDDGKELDLRVSTLPTVNGEKVVMRIQDESREIPTLEQLGLQGNSLKFLLRGIAAPNGIVLTSGPTGSGKTTTLYSCMHMLNKPEVNILSFEDPVEIQMDGLNQSQIHSDIEYTFARGLRTALRQDPNIIMVGEIRDRETVDIAIEASLTGHLVLSTIHTNSAVETITRIDNMGVPLFLLTATVNTIIAQRLVRKLCECREADAPDAGTLEMINKGLAALPADEPLDPKLKQNLVFYKPKGCEKCNSIGYHGRVGLYEVLNMTNELRRGVIQRLPSMDLQKIAMQSGMVTLEQAGLIKALQGTTSLSEVYRVAKQLE